MDAERREQTVGCYEAAIERFRETTIPESRQDALVDGAGDCYSGSKEKAHPFTGGMNPTISSTITRITDHTLSTPATLRRAV